MKDLIFILTHILLPATVGYLLSRKKSKNDPVYSCEVYTETKDKCSHVDGPLCNIETCSTLKDYKASITRPSGTQADKEILEQIKDW